MMQGATKTMGVLFADISGTTRLYQKLGTVEAGYAVDRGIKRMERAIEGHHGDVLTHASDQLVAIFASADEAVTAAVEMQKRVGDLLPISGVKLTIRIGVHAAEGGAEVAEVLAAKAKARLGAVPVESKKAEEMPSVPVVESARRLLTMSGPGQIFTCGRTARMLSPPVQQMLWSCEGLALTLPEGGESQVYQVRWISEDDTLATQTLEAASSAAALEAVKSDSVAAPLVDGHFCVRSGGRTYLLDERTPQLEIGRDKKNDIVIKDPKASRLHARIEQREGGRVVLVDLSTNGTFVLDGTAETKVRSNEILLGNKGQIAFGHSPRDRGAECIEFERV